MGSTSLGLHRWPILGVNLPQRSTQLLPKFYSLSSERCRRGGFGFRACSSKLKKSIRGCATNAFVVADDEKYGNKQNISITPRLYDYILANVREPEVLRQLREETASMRGSQMQVSPDQAQLLAMLVQIHGAEKCIEVGIYTGYSSLAIALVLPESGRLIACERDARSLEVAKKYYNKANVSHKVRVGGLIVFDNVFWHGKVADPEVNDAKTVSIRKFNADIMMDERVSISMVPIGDGMTICRKR